MKIYETLSQVLQEQIRNVRGDLETNKWKDPNYNKYREREERENERKISVVQRKGERMRGNFTKQIKYYKRGFLVLVYNHTKRIRLKNT